MSTVCCLGTVCVAVCLVLVALGGLAGVSRFLVVRARARREEAERERQRRIEDQDADLRRLIDREERR